MTRYAVWVIFLFLATGCAVSTRQESPSVRLSLSAIRTLSRQNLLAIRVDDAAKSMLNARKLDALRYDLPYRISQLNIRSVLPSSTGVECRNLAEETLLYFTAVQAVDAIDARSRSSRRLAAQLELESVAAALRYDSLLRRRDILQKSEKLLPPSLRRELAGVNAQLSNGAMELRMLSGTAPLAEFEWEFIDRKFPLTEPELMLDYALHFRTELSDGEKIPSSAVRMLEELLVPDAKNCESVLLRRVELVLNLPSLLIRRELAERSVPPEIGRLLAALLLDAELKMDHQLLIRAEQELSAVKGDDFESNFRREEKYEQYLQCILRLRCDMGLPPDSSLPAIDAIGVLTPEWRRAADAAARFLMPGK